MSSAARAGPLPSRSRGVRVAVRGESGHWCSNRASATDSHVRDPGRNERGCGMIHASFRMAIFYDQQPTRIVVLAILDLRQDAEQVSRRLR